MLLPVIREIQIKTTMRYHFIFTKMAIVFLKKKKTESKYWEGYKEPLVLLVGMQNGIGAVGKSENSSRI